MRGFSAIELLVALMLLASLAIASVLLTFGTPLVLQSASEHAAALALAESVLMRLESTGQAVPVATSSIERYTVTSRRVLLPDRSTERFSVEVAWEGIGDILRQTVLTAYRTDYRNPGEYSCDLFPRGDWALPQVETYRLVSGELLPSDWTGGTVRAADLAATRTLLAVTVESTDSAGAPSLLLFSLVDREPVYASALALSSTTAAAADIALIDTLALVASASTCTNPARCGHLKVIDMSDPAQPFLMAQLLLSRTEAPYATSGSGAAAARSIAYHDGVVYLGLEQVSHPQGLEFNIIDVSRPERPVWLGGFRVGRTVNAITLWDDRAYLATNVRANADVLVLETTNPSSVAEQARVPLPPLSPTSTFGYAHALALYTGELHIGRSYVSNADEWIIADADDPSLPIRGSRNPGSALAPASIRALILREGQALVVTTLALEVWRRSRVFDPEFVTSVPLRGGVADAVCVGNDLFVLAEDRLVRISGS